MKVLVAVKRDVDPNVHIRVKSDGTGVELCKPTFSRRCRNSSRAWVEAVGVIERR